MQKKSNLLSRVRKCPNKSGQIYFSLGTALDLSREKDPKTIFVVSFGEKEPKLPKGVIHKHFTCDRVDLDYTQPFKLDSILVDAKTGVVIDTVGALIDIKNKVVATTENPYETLLLKPELAIRAAALVAETDYSICPKLENAMKKMSPLALGGGKKLWKEFKRLMRAKLPSKGINLLRETKILREILPELDDCYGVSQNKSYHKYTVYEHCVYACDACIDYDPRLRFAALIHDVGKPPVKGSNEKGITFHKHEVVSTKMAKNIVKRLGLNREDGNFVVTLVSNHMYQYDRRWKDSTVLKFIDRVGLHKGFIGNMQRFPLFQLRNADRMGRGLHPVTRKQLDFEDRLEKALKGSFRK